MRWILGVLTVTAAATAHADPDWQRCADEEMKAAPANYRELTSVLRHGRSAADWEMGERNALHWDRPLRDLLLLALEANDRHDPTEVAHVADLMELTAATTETRWREGYLADVSRIEGEGYLAQVQLVAGNAARAQEHFANGMAVLAKAKAPIYNEYTQLWAAAIVMHDDVARAQLQNGYLATGKTKLEYDAKDLTRQGAGWGLLAAADAIGGTTRQDILDEMMKGIDDRRDYPLAAEIAKRLEPTRRLMGLARLDGFPLADAERQITDLVKAAIPVAARASDDARGALISVAANDGLAADVLPLAATFANPWRRAEQEAVVAIGLVLIDKPAAIALVHRALERAQTPFRKDSDDDRKYASNTRYWAARALARAGLVDEAAQYSDQVSDWDVMIGVRDDAKALAAWWDHASADTRGGMMTSAMLGEPLYRTYLVPFCKQ